MAEGKAASAADSSVSDVGSGAAVKLIEMLSARMDSMQTDFKKALDDVTTTAKSWQQTGQLGSITEKLDVGSDESQSAGVVLDAGNKRSFDNYIAYQTVRFADRDRTHFDNMQALTQLAYGNVTFALGLAQTLAVADTHQQYGRSADWRAATIASKHENK